MYVYDVLYEGGNRKELEKLMDICYELGKTHRNSFTHFDVFYGETCPGPLLIKKEVPRRNKWRFGFGY